MCVRRISRCACFIGIAPGQPDGLPRGCPGTGCHQKPDSDPIRRDVRGEGSQTAPTIGGGPVYPYRREKRDIGWIIGGTHLRERQMLVPFLRAVSTRSRVRHSRWRLSGQTPERRSAHTGGDGCRGIFRAVQKEARSGEGWPVKPDK